MCVATKISLLYSTPCKNKKILISSKMFTDSLVEELIFENFYRKRQKFADLHFENTNLYNFVRNVRGLAIRGGRQITSYIGKPIRYIH
jgi:hypothetical protein